MQQEIIKISKIKNNIGQIDGLPKNPRKVKTSALEDLRRSIIESPEILEFRSLVVFPFEDNYIAIMGNQRLTICRSLKYKELPCFVLSPDTSIEKLKEYIAKDNIHAGTFDMDYLLENWGLDLLVSWSNDFFPEKKEEQIQNVAFTATKPNPYILTVNLISEADREVLYEKLQKEGYECWYGKRKPNDK